MLTALKCPTGKKIFRHPNEAAPYLEAMRQKEHPARAAKLQVYNCRFCGWFHAGHSRPQGNTARRGRHRRAS